MASKYEYAFDDPRVNEVIANGRSLSDCLVKIVAVFAATSITVGHLTSLREMPEAAQTRSIAGFWLCPFFPIAELVVNVYRTVGSARIAKGSNDWAYCITASLGARACAEGNEADQVETVDLLELRDRRRCLRRATRPRGARWLARIAVLIAFLIQAMSVTVFYFRRISMAAEYKYATDSYPIFRAHADAMFDNMNAQFAMGSFVAGVVSLALTICNWSWTYRETIACQGLLNLRRAMAREKAHWRQVLPSPSTSPVWAEMVVSLLLTTLAQISSLWSASESGVFLFSIVHLPLTASSYTGPWSTTIVALPLILLVASFEETPLTKRENIINMVSASASFLLASYRIIEFIDVATDLRAVHGCNTRSKTWCVPVFAWRDPKEGLLWTF